MLLAEIRPIETWNALGILGGLALLALVIALIVATVRVIDRR